MSRNLPFVRLLDGAVELGWLFLIIAVPTFFNVRDNRVFEPDKIVLMRNVVLIMILIFLLKALYLAPLSLPRLIANRAAPHPEGTRYPVAGAGEAVTSAPGEYPAAPASRSGPAAILRRWPIVAATAVFMVIYLVATLHSIIPSISFWGSYDRLEGYYTYLNYIALFLLVATHLRTWAQVERLVTAIVVSSVPAASYSWIQHFTQDPLVWGSDASIRTPSTLGNPIFLAAFLLMTVPFTLYRLLLRVQAVLANSRAGVSDASAIWTALGAVGYGVALVLQMTAIGFSGSRGPALGFLAALVVFGLSLAIRQRITWLLRTSLAFAILLLLVLGATNTVFQSSSTPSGGLSRFLHVLPSESGTSEVRSLLWKSSFSLAKVHPLLGCGPEVLLFCWYPDYPPDLRKVEAANAAPDRSHDEEIDVLLMSGILGELAYLAVLVTTIGTLIVLIRRARDMRTAAFACALLAAYVGHIVEGVTGIAFSATLLLLWMIAGAASALRGGSPTGIAGLFLGRGEDAPAGASHLAAPAGGYPAAWSGADIREAASTPVARGAPGPRGGRANAQGTARPDGPRRQARQPGRRNEQRLAPPRRQQERGARYAFWRALGALPPPTQALVGAGALVLVAIAVGFGILFAGNIQVIMADVAYHSGVGYETAAGQYTTTAIQAQAAQASAASPNTAWNDYQSGLQTYQAAVDSYQQALDDSTQWPYAGPPQDNYFLFLGKALIEYADALNRDPATPSAATRNASAVEQIQLALSVFERASKNNPLNPDHPRNTAKLYSFWGINLSPGNPDLAKLRLADEYYARASSLAPHNADILDEWATLDIRLGGLDGTHARQWYADARAHLERAESLFPEDGTIYRDLGVVYYQYAVWAEQAKQPAQAHTYYVQARDAWLKALGAPPVTQAAANYQTVYPDLATVLWTQFHDVCEAGQYAQFALNAVKAGTLSETTQMEQTLQATVSAAQAQKGCTIKQQ